VLEKLLQHESNVAHCVKSFMMVRLILYLIT